MCWLRCLLLGTCFGAWRRGLSRMSLPAPLRNRREGLPIPLAAAEFLDNCSIRRAARHGGAATAAAAAAAAATAAAATATATAAAGSHLCSRLLQLAAERVATLRVGWWVAYDLSALVRL